MTPTNLRALVAKAYRVRQGRTFSSSAPNPIADEGRRSVKELLLDCYSSPYFTAGFVFKLGWETWLLHKSAQKSDELRELYKRELEIDHKESLRRIRGSSEE